MRLFFVIVTLVQSACAPTSQSQVNWNSMNSNQYASQSAVTAGID